MRTTLPYTLLIGLLGGCGMLAFEERAAPDDGGADLAADAREMPDLVSAPDVPEATDMRIVPSEDAAPEAAALDLGVAPEPVPPTISGGGAVNFVSTNHDGAGNLYVVGNTEQVLELGESIPPGRAFVASYGSDGALRWVESWESTRISTVWDVAVEGERVTIGGHQSGETLTPFAFDAGGRQRAIAVTFGANDGSTSGTPINFQSPRGNVQCKGLSGAGGRIAMSGNYIGELDVGFGPLPSTPRDIDHGFIIVLEESGDARWARSIGGATVFLNRPMMRADGGAWAVGNFRNGTIDSAPTARGQDGVAIAFASDGTTEHTYSLQSSAGDDIRDVMPFEGGAVIAGSIGSSATLFIDGVGEALGATAGANDAVVVALGADGSLRWSTNVGGSGSDRMLRLDVTPEGRVVAAGAFLNTLDIAGERLVSAGGNDLMLVVLDSSGTPIDALSIGGSGDDTVSGLEPTEGGYWVTISHDAPFTFREREYVPPMSAVFVPL
ncbi:MAG: hypothetical protein AAF645_12870 [Myxococcota bacterium]